MAENVDTVTYLPLTKNFYSQVIILANNVHGQGYLDIEKLEDWVTKGSQNKVNSSFKLLIVN